MNRKSFLKTCGLGVCAVFAPVSLLFKRKSERDKAFDRCRFSAEDAGIERANLLSCIDHCLLIRNDGNYVGNYLKMVSVRNEAYIKTFCDGDLNLFFVLLHMFYMQYGTNVISKNIGLQWVNFTCKLFN